MNQLIKDNLFNIIVILSCTFILQSHSIDLFKQMMPNNTVLAWVTSIGLEYVALWAWYNIGWYWRLAHLLIAIPVSASLALVAFMNISAPTSQGIASVNKANEKLELNKNKTEVLGDTLKGASKHGLHPVTKESFKDFRQATEDQGKLIDEKYSNRDLDKLKLEFNIQAVIMAFFMIAQIVADIMISQYVRSKNVPEIQNENIRTVVEPKQEQHKEQQQNTLKPTLLSSYACKVKTELMEYMKQNNIDVPSRMMQKMNLHRGIYTKLKNTCDQRESDTLGMEKMKEIESKLEQLKHSH